MGAESTPIGGVVWCVLGVRPTVFSQRTYAKGHRENGKHIEALCGEPLLLRRLVRVGVGGRLRVGVRARVGVGVGVRGASASVGVGMCVRDGGGGLGGSGAGEGSGLGGG